MGPEIEPLDQPFDHGEVVTHRLLRRQLRRVGITGSTPSEPQWRAFLGRVDRAYHHADDRQAVVDQTLNVSSDEMRGRLDEVLQRADERVVTEHDRLDRVVAAMPTALMMFDRGGRIVSVNDEAQRLFGGPHVVGDRHMDEVLLIEGDVGDPQPLLARSDLEAVLTEARWERSGVRLVVRAPASDASQPESESTTIAADVVIVPFAVDDPELGGLIAVTDNAHDDLAVQLAAWQATHDALTGLGNRHAVTERIELALHAARRTGTDWPTLLLVDVDHFRAVNETSGHGMGDRLLIAVGERLQQCVRGIDTVARLDGDQFVILCDGVGDSEQRGNGVRGWAERILQLLAEPFDLTDGQRTEQIAVTASIGIAGAAATHQDANAVLRDAELAVHSAKQAGRNRYDVADEKRRLHAAEHSQMERALRTAIARREITVVYQPVQSTTTGELMGFEALARWVHPTLGDVRPNRFVPVAEQAGLIEALGDRMFDLACRDVATWNRERKSLGLAPIVVHVNISGRELQAAKLLARVRHAMREHAVLPNWIMLEMTETTLLDASDTTLERMRELKRAGIRVAIDDFGTGYSSLAALRRYPIHMIKIDREFISEIASSKQDQSIVKAMIDLAHGLDHEVLAEGVETTAELDLLRSFGCGLVQGYLLGMPMPSEDALLLATSCRTQTPDPELSASAGTAHLRPRP